MFFLQILLNSLVIGTQVLLLAAGLYLIYAVAKMYHIALAGIMTAGAYAYYSFSSLFTPAIAFIAALIVSFLLGTLSWLILHKLVQKKQSLLALLASVTLWLSIESVIAIIYGSDGKFIVSGILPTLQIGDISLPYVGVWTIGIGIFFACAAYIILHSLPSGRIIRAIAQHPECASLIGIQENKTRLWIFGLAAALTGLIGIFTAMYNALTPSMGANLIIMAFIALIVGGVTDFKGTVTASYLVVLISEGIVSLNFGASSISNSWKMVIVFILALLLLMLKPQGLFSISLRKS